MREAGQFGGPSVQPVTDPYMAEQTISLAIAYDSYSLTWQFGRNELR